MTDEKISVLSWNVRRLEKSLDRADRIAGIIRSEDPDIFGLIEFKAKDLVRAIMIQHFPDYDFGLTESSHDLEILVGWRREKFCQAIFTQRREFRVQSQGLRPGAVLSAFYAGVFYNFLFLHTDSGTTKREYSNRKKMYEKVWSMNKALKKLEIMKGRSNLVVLGDLNTMGNGSTISSKQEIMHLKKSARKNGMHLLRKNYNETWHDWKIRKGSSSNVLINLENLPGARTADLDHILISEGMNPRELGEDGGSSFNVRVRGWNQLENENLIDFLKNISDHSAIYAEVEILNVGGNIVMSENKLHSVQELQGVGPVIAKKLEERSFCHAEEILSMRNQDLETWAEVIKGLSADKLRNEIIPQARMLLLDGMNGQIAEGLVRSGIKTLRDLVDLDAKTIVSRLEERAKEGVIPEAPDQAMVIDWMLKAARLVGTGFLHLRVLDSKTKKPIAGVDVILTGRDPLVPAPWKVTTDRNGLAWFAGLIPGKHRASISKTGYKEQITISEIQPDLTANRRIYLTGGELSEVIVDEFDGEVIGNVSLSWKIQTHLTKLENFPKKPPVAIVKINEDEVTLCSIYRKRVNYDLHVYTFKMLKKDLPEGVKLYDILEPAEDGAYVSYDGNAADYRRDMELERLGGKEKRVWAN